MTYDELIKQLIAERFTPVPPAPERTDIIRTLDPSDTAENRAIRRAELSGKAVAIRKPDARAEWLEDLEWMLDNGESVAAICQRMHLAPDAIRKRLQRAGRDDLAVIFRRFAS